MIQTKEDYQFYLEADRISLNIEYNRPKLFQDEIWKFQRLLRRVEHLKNCGKNIVNKINLKINWMMLRKFGIYMGFSIWPNTFGPGLSIAHWGSIVVSPYAKIGENCRLHQCVTIGRIWPPESVEYNKWIPKDTYPKIGNNVYIAPGTIIVGDIEIADGIAIGANSFVNKSFKEKNITIAGNPAKKISNKSSKEYWFRATEILRTKIK